MGFTFGYIVFNADNTLKYGIIMAREEIYE